MKRFVLGMALVVSGCSNPARIESAVGDTIIVNATGPVSLPVRVVSADGRTLRRARVRYSVQHGNALAVTGDTVSCREKGDANVRLRAGRASRDLTILCRPFRTISFLEPLELKLGAPPHRFILGAYDERNRPVSELAFGLEVMDTTVVVAKNGWIFARGPGETYVRVHIGRCMTDVPVRVRSASAGRAPAKKAVPRAPIHRNRMCAQLLWLS